MRFRGRIPFPKDTPAKENSLGNDTAGGKRKHGYELVGFSYSLQAEKWAGFKLVAKNDVARCR